MDAQELRSRKGSQTARGSVEVRGPVANGADACDGDEPNGPVANGEDACDGDNEGYGEEVSGDEGDEKGFDQEACDEDAEKGYGEEVCGESDGAGKEVMRPR